MVFQSKYWRHSLYKLIGGGVDIEVLVDLDEPHQSLLRTPPTLIYAQRSFSKNNYVASTYSSSEYAVPSYRYSSYYNRGNWDIRAFYPD